MPFSSSDSITLAASVCIGDLSDTLPSCQYSWYILAISLIVTALDVSPVILNIAFLDV